MLALPAAASALEWPRVQDQQITVAWDTIAAEMKLAA